MLSPTAGIVPGNTSDLSGTVFVAEHKLVNFGAADMGDVSGPHLD